MATCTKIALDSTSLNIERHTFNKKENEKCRVFNEAANETFKAKIHEESWDDAFNDTLDTNTLFSKFLGTYNEHYYTAYPLKSKSIRRRNERKNSKPWILPWLEDACARKNKLYHEFVKNPSPQNKTKYNKLKKFCKIHIEKAKATYYKKYFDEHK